MRTVLNQWPCYIVIPILFIRGCFIRLLSPLRCFLRKHHLLKDSEYYFIHLNGKELSNWKEDMLKRRLMWEKKHPKLTRVKLWYKVGIGEEIVEFSFKSFKSQLNTDDENIVPSKGARMNLLGTLKHPQGKKGL